MASTERLFYDILARDGASSKFRDVGNAADRAGKQTSNFGTSMAGAMKLAAGAFIGAGLVEGFKNLYNAAAEAQKIGRLTEQVIKTTGGAAGVTAKQVGDLAGQIAAKTGVDDEAIQSGQNLILTFTNIKNAAGAGNDIFNQTTQIMTDMSVALGKDASSSAIILGKALNDPIKGITALSRAGVSFTAQQKDQIRTMVEAGDILGAQKIILAELGKEFGGAAEAAATPLDKLRVRAGNLAEQIGGYLVPAVDKASTWLSENLIPALSTIGSIAADVAVPAFKAIASVVGVVADAFNSLPGPLQVGVVALGAFVALRGPLTSAMETIGLKALYMRDMFVNAGTGMGGFKAAGAGLLGFLGGPWGLAIAGAATGLSFLVGWLNDGDKATENVTRATQDYKSALEAANGVITESVRQSAAKSAQDAGLLDVADDLGLSLTQVTDAITGQGAALDSVRQKLTDYAITQQTEIMDANGQVTVSITEQGQAALDARDALDNLSGQTVRTAGDQDQLTRATDSTGGSMAAFAAEIEATRTELSEGKQAIDDFKLSLDILTGQSVSMIEVESQLQDAYAAATDAMKETGGAVLDTAGKLNLQSENGRIAADVLLDVRNSGNDLIATLIQQGATADQVRAADAKLRQSFIDTAIKMGISEQAALDLANQILGIPAERETTITADTGQATNAVSTLQRGIDGLRGRTVTIQAVLSQTGGMVGNIRNMTPGLATGGPIFGPGTSTSDSILARLSNDEHVLTAREVKAAGGHGAIKAWRKSLVKGYATGGPVGIAALFDSNRYEAEANAAASALGRRVAAQITQSGVAGGGAVGGGWSSIWNYVKARVPAARINSTFRPGDPGYHGRGKAIDFGYGTGPGGAGSAGLALINRVLHDGVGRNLAELIYDGIGDDRPDLKNGRPLTYNAATRAAHRNHVHAAVFDTGGILRPGLTLAYNGTGRNEHVVTGPPPSAPPAQFVGNLYLDSGQFIGVVRGEMAQRDAQLARNMRSSL